MQPDTKFKRRMLAVLALSLLVEPTAGLAEAVAFSHTGLEGAGFQNVVAVDPSNASVLLSGGDVSGIQRSIDGGASWQAANTGVAGLINLRVAAFLFSPVVADRVYAAVGDRDSGGLLQSDDSGATWAVLSTVPQFHGNSDDLPTVHPRSTGNLIAQDPVTGALYVATFNQGAMRSDDGGATWTLLGLQGLYLRSLALDPVDPAVLYAGSYGQGLHKSTDAGGLGGFTLLPLAPSTVEELSIAGGTLYAAAGTAGVQISSDGGATWQMSIGQLHPGATWMSIAAWTACDGSTVVYAGAYLSSPETIVRSSDGGITWVSVTSDKTRIHPNVGGPLGAPWWLLANRPKLKLGGSSSTPSQITLTPDPSDACVEPGVLVAGRSGIWGSTNSGSDWYPMVGKMGVTVLESLALDPAAPTTVHVVARDWTFLTSTDNGESFVSPIFPKAAGTAFDVAVDATVSPSRVYIALGNSTGNKQGGILSSDAPAVAASWRNERLNLLAGNKRPLAIAVGHVGGSPLLLAAVDGGGIYRKVDDTWSKVATNAMSKSKSALPIQMIWPSGTEIVYLNDRRSGIWRSTDAGLTWDMIWAKSSTGRYRDYIAADATGSTLWVVSGTTLYRIDNASSGTVAAGTLTPVPVVTTSLPGPVAVGPAGTVYLAVQAADNLSARLLRSDDWGSSWIDVADDTYRASALVPSRLVIDVSGDIWVCTAGNGLLHGIVQ